MIPEFAITEWSSVAPWKEKEQVEQDLLICRALTEIYKDEYLATHLAFRGGTALHKLYLQPQPRYSEDIDLVQITAEPIKETYIHLRQALAFLGEPVVKQKRHNNTLLFRVQSEGHPSVPLHIKVEINCNEHFSELGFDKVLFSMESGWFSGSCEVTAYRFDEMLGTKFNAVYGRKKTRDLFDMDYVLKHAKPDVDKVLACWRRYKSELGEDLPSWREYVANVESKMADPGYRNGMDGLLRPGIEFDAVSAWANVKSGIVDRLMTDRDRAELEKPQSRV